MKRKMKLVPHVRVAESAAVLLVACFLLVMSAYVAHASQTASDMYAQANEVSANTPTYESLAPVAPSLRHLDIKEWGIRINYYSGYDLSYWTSDGGVHGNDIAALTSSQLESLDKGCTSGAATAFRAAPNTQALPSSSRTVQQLAAQDPSNYARIGNYYYYIKYDRSPCSKIPNARLLYGRLIDVVSAISAKDIQPIPR